MDLVGELSVGLEDGAVHFTYRVRNRGEARVDLQFRTGQRVEVIVAEAETGHRAWKASEGRMYTMAIGFLQLAPGEVATFDEVWREPPPGTYRAEAMLTADTASAPAEATFTVP